MLTLFHEPGNVFGVILTVAKAFLFSWIWMLWLMFSISCVVQRLYERHVHANPYMYMAHDVDHQIARKFSLDRTCISGYVHHTCTVYNQHKYNVDVLIWWLINYMGSTRDIASQSPPLCLTESLIYPHDVISVGRPHLSRGQKVVVHWPIILCASRQICASWLFRHRFSCK